MKIVGGDNFDRETIDDILIADNIRFKTLGEIMVKALNDKLCSHDDDLTFYTLVENEYVLRKFQP